VIRFCFKYRLYGISLFLCLGAARAQTAPASTDVDLAAPALNAHASLPRYNPPGPPLSDSLVKGRQLATEKGVPWKGVRWITPDEVGNTSLNPTSVLQLYQKQACLADAIAIGHTDVWVHHLSTNGTAIYADYAFVIDSLLKDNVKSAIGSRHAIVVTRPGGSISLPDGPLTSDFQGFPHLQAGTTYLMFLVYIPASSAAPEVA
jgi:hypothetical protein